MRPTRRVLGLIVVLGALAGCQKAPDTPVEPGETRQVDRSELEICEYTGTPLTARDCAKAQRIAESARTGAAAFKAPDVMRQGESQTVMLAIGEKPKDPEPQPASPRPSTPAPTDTAPAPDEAPPDPSPPPPPEGTGGQTAARPVPKAARPPPPTPEETVAAVPGVMVTYAPIIGSRMSAELLGPGFEITPSGPVVQTVSTGGITTWQWEVKAQRAGDRSLTVKTQVVIQDSLGNVVPLKQFTHVEPVKVRVGWFSYGFEVLKTLPTWINALAAVLVALAGLVAAWWKFRGSLRRPKVKDAA